MQAVGSTFIAEHLLRGQSRLVELCNDGRVTLIAAKASAACPLGRTDGRTPGIRRVCNQPSQPPTMQQSRVNTIMQRACMRRSASLQCRLAVTCRADDACMKSRHGVLSQRALVECDHAQTVTISSDDNVTTSSVGRRPTSFTRLNSSSISLPWRCRSVGRRRY